MPVLLGAGAGLITGSASWLMGLSGRECIMRMAISVVLFFLVGLFSRNHLQEILLDVRMRRQEAEHQAAQEEADRRKAEKRLAEESPESGTRFDQRIGDESRGDAFSPGRVADFIRQEMENG
jgi:Tfp pilus assembly protein PilX